MASKPKKPDPEIEAFKAITKVMKPFPQEARDRMLRYLRDRYCASEQ